jgi:hypothetical protein
MSNTGNAVSVSAMGDRQGCILIREELEVLLNGNKLWYSPLYPSREIYSVAVFVFALVVAFFGGAFLLSLTGIDPKNSWAQILVSISMLAVFGLEFYLKKKLFPSLLFDIGYSERQSQQAKSLRKFIFGTVIAGVLIKVAVDHYLK